MGAMETIARTELSNKKKIYCLFVCLWYISKEHRRVNLLMRLNNSVIQSHELVPLLFFMLHLWYKMLLRFLPSVGSYN